MGAYLIRRLLLVIPTLWAIITINFFIVQIAPGGPLIRRLPPLSLAITAACPAAAAKT
jgi:microcin C transport system permease protein